MLGASAKPEENETPSQASSSQAEPGLCGFLLVRLKITSFIFPVTPGVASSPGAAGRHRANPSRALLSGGLQGHAIGSGARAERGSIHHVHLRQLSAKLIICCPSDVPPTSARLWGRLGPSSVPPKGMGTIAESRGSPVGGQEPGGHPSSWQEHSLMLRFVSAGAIIATDVILRWEVQPCAPLRGWKHHK